MENTIKIQDLIFYLFIALNAIFRQLALLKLGTSFIYEQIKYSALSSKKVLIPSHVPFLHDNHTLASYSPPLAILALT